jgi:cell division protein FtsA
VVLTGGGSELTGGGPGPPRVRDARPRGNPGAGLGGLADAVRKPRFATATGLALFGAETRLSGGGGMPGVFGKAVQWLREFF